MRGSLSLMLAAACLIGCTPAPGGGAGNPQASPTPQASASPATNQTQTVTVSVKNMAFNPSTVTIPVGGTVVWKFEDSMAHSSTSDAGSAKQWDSGVQSSGTYSVTFDQAGSFPYHCTPHSTTMMGTVVVQ